MPFDVATLKGDHLLWRRIHPQYFSRRADDLPEIATAAFSAVDHWNSIANTDQDTAQGGSIDGALTAIGHYVSHYPNSAHSTCRRVGRYFRSANINCAFGAVRKFEYPIFSRYTIFVSDQLIDVATWDNATPSPVEMTLRGIAFRSLFGLDPQYKHWPQLRRARDECVHGLLTWGANSDAHQATAAQITRYLNRAT